MPHTANSLHLDAHTLKTEIRDTYHREVLGNPPDTFGDTADWEWAWSMLLADAIEIVNDEELLTDPTGKPVTLVIRGNTEPPSTTPITIEANDSAGTSLGTYTYTGHMPPRPNRPTVSTWEQAAADSHHAMLTLINDLTTTTARNHP